MVEVVEAHEICPYSRRSRETGELQRDVVLDAELSITETLAAFDRTLAKYPAAVVIIIVFPRVTVDHEAWDRFVQSVRGVDQERAGGSPAFAAATFHPDYPLDPRTPHTLVPFFRRSPDPSIQFVRLRVLDDIRGGKHGKFHFDVAKGDWAALQKRLTQVSVTERIAADNFAMAETQRAVLEAKLADIHADRDATYARLLGGTKS